MCRDYIYGNRLYRMMIRYECSDYIYGNKRACGTHNIALLGDPKNRLVLKWQYPPHELGALSCSSCAHLLSEMPIRPLQAKGRLSSVQQA